jgi:mRNA interferase MazF
VKRGKEETLSNLSSIPKRRDIWLVNLDPTIGTEIKKVRPAVVVSSNAIGRLPIKLVALLTDWKEYFAANIWHVRVNSDPATGLIKASAIDTLQLRGLDQQRFIRKLGEVSPATMEEITLAIATVIEYP